MTGRLDARAGREGLTLVEVLATLAIAAVLLTTLSSVLATTLRSVRHARRRMRAARVATGLEAFLRRDLAHAVGLRERGYPPFIGRTPQADEETVFAEFISTRSASHGAVSGTGLYRVAYILRPTDEAAEAYDFLRRETPYREAGETVPPEVAAERLADGIRSCFALFYDGRRWQSTWSEAMPPEAVRLDVQWWSVPADEEASVTTTLILTPWTGVNADPSPAAPTKSD